MSSILTDLWQAISGNPALAGGLALLALVVLLLLLFAGQVARIYGRLRRAARPGRIASAGLPDSDLPLCSLNRHGKPGDPVNVEVVATASQIAAAFAAAAWYRADEIDLVTSVRIAVDSVLARPYSSAPVSNLYLFGRKEDFAFERPGQSVRERDHIRLWNTGRDAPDGRPIWIGGATRDVKVELAKTNHLPTHQIAPDVDTERDLVVSELARTGWVVDEGWRLGFGTPTHGVNGTGDPYDTDGRVAVLTLANVWVPVITQQVRGPLEAGVYAGLARLLQWRLPRAGRERARREVSRLRERLHARHRSAADSTGSATPTPAAPTAPTAPPERGARSSHP